MKNWYLTDINKNYKRSTLKKKDQEQFYTQKMALKVT